MKKWILSLAALASLLPAAADNRSSELLGRLQRNLEGMEGYRVDFTVALEEGELSGYYRVRGRSYYMIAGEAEVYCDGTVRREVDPSKREVVVDLVDPSSRNILNNPTQAFSLIDGSYAHELLSEQNGVATVRLVPTSSSKAGVSRLTLEMNTKDCTPRRLIYDSDGECVTILIRNIEADRAPLPPFSMENYPGFELIDFR